MSPSGKAADFESAIRWFESSHPRAPFLSTRGYGYERDIMMKTPGSDHPITIEPNRKRVTVTFAGETIADTRRAMTLQEADYPPVVYVPREDAAMAFYPNRVELKESS